MACNEVAYVQPLLYHFNIIIYILNVPRFTTFQKLFFFLVFISKKHTTILADINLRMIHTDPLDKFFGMVHVFR
jgi:hypothetical protein